MLRRLLFSGRIFVLRLLSGIYIEPPEVQELSYIHQMAPSVLDSQPTAPHELSNLSHGNINRKIFPDGIKTSGQHPPLYNALRPYSDFPKEITGPTVWKAEDYTNNPEQWVHNFNDEEIEELGVVADKFLADGIPLTGISQVGLQTITNHVTCLHTEPSRKIFIFLSSLFC